MFARSALRQATSRFASSSGRITKSTTRRVFSSQAPAANSGAGGAMVLAGVALVAAAYSASNATDQANKIQGKLHQDGTRMSRDLIEKTLKTQEMSVGTKLKLQLQQSLLRHALHPLTYQV